MTVREQERIEFFEKKRDEYRRVRKAEKEWRLEDAKNHREREKVAEEGKMEENPNII